MKHSLTLIGLIARQNARRTEFSDLESMSLHLSRDGEPILYCHRPTRVTAFLSALLHDKWIEVLRSQSPSLWDILGKSFVNFSHFSEDIAHKDAHDSLTRDGVFCSYLRGRAIVCRKGQKGLDLVIPMVILSKGKQLESPVESSDISVIIVQVKNRKADTCRFTKEKLDIKYIEGLRASSTKPYVGIWMSFRTETQDLSFDRGSPITGKTVES